MVFSQYNTMKLPPLSLYRKGKPQNDKYSLLLLHHACTFQTAKPLYWFPFLSTLFFPLSPNLLTYSLPLFLPPLLTQEQFLPYVVSLLSSELSMLEHFEFPTRLSFFKKKSRRKCKISLFYFPTIRYIFLLLCLILQKYSGRRKDRELSRCHPMSVPYPFSHFQNRLKKIPIRDSLFFFSRVPSPITAKGGIWASLYFLQGVEGGGRKSVG